MITFYALDQKKLVKLDTGLSLPTEVIWIDMLQPTREEEALVEAALNIDVPTREEMNGIELSKRLYTEGNDLFMTAMVVAGSDAPQPAALPVSFVLTAHKLITVRYHEPRSFEIFVSRALKSLEQPVNGADILTDLLDTIIDRLSDPLVDMSEHLDKLSHDVFKSQEQKTDFNHLLRTIGQKGDLNSKVKESLVTLDRLIAFLSFNLQPASKAHKGNLAHLKSLEQDIRSLTEHANFLSNKINFLLQAALGMISIEQNSIIKFFSVAAVIFLPPTLIASIYGMNFQHMPELNWVFAYPATIVVMLLSAILPYVYFRHKGWL